MRMIIAGSRGADRPGDYELLKQYVKTNCPRPSEIISGTAKGGDQQGERLAAEFGIPLTRMPADWDKHGKGAGMIRNGDMAVYASDVPDSMLVALWDGRSKGTMNMISVAQNYGLVVHVIEVPATEVRTVGASPVLAAPYHAQVQQPQGDVYAQAAPQVLAQLPPVVAAAKDVTPAVPYIFPQSHSSLNVFETCPRQYEAKYITKEVQFVQTPQAKWGDEAHLVLEGYLKSAGTAPIPSNMEHYKRFGDWVLERAAKGGGQVLAERMSGIDQMGHAVQYRSKQRWLGGKIDVTILYPQTNTAEVFDWKTGKVKNDQTQLRLYGALTLADYREVSQVSAGYIWLEHNQISPPSFYQRADYYQHLDPFKFAYEKLKSAYVRGVFEPRPNGLCEKWCDVKSCEFHGRGRR